MPNVTEFNAHQQDVRNRADSLARVIFILSGGALTLSVGIFGRTTAPDLPSHVESMLRLSWASLIAAILLLVITLVTIIARDYKFGEKCRQQLIDESVDASGTPGWPDRIIWSFGILGIAAFILGMAGLAYAAVHL